MAALLNKKRLQEAREAKKGRMRSIRKAAEHFFARMPYHEVTIDAIGSRAGVRQGQAIMYFGSKEELFAVVLRDKLEHWASELGPQLQRSGNGADFDEVARVLAGSFAENPGLCRFLAQASMVLEIGVEVAAVDSALRVLHHRIEELGELIEDRAKGLPKGSGGEVLRRLVRSVMGSYSFADPRGAMAMALCDDRIQPLKVDIGEELTFLACTLLEVARES